MTLPRTTQEVAKFLGVSYTRFDLLIRKGRMRAPAKDSSGRYVWDDSDIENARRAMKVDRRRKEHRAALAERRAGA